MDVRRVVTGHDAQGRAVFASDTKVPPLTMALLPGSEFHRLWGGDEAQTFPDDGNEPPQKMYFPPVGGYRFGFFSLPPEGTAGPAINDLAAATAEMEQKLPGLLQYLESDNPGMHTTDTVDFEVVLQGEVELELDDGAKVTLHPGDTVVQNGTRHRWRNPGTEHGVLAVFIAGANRS
jgi:mannose-6-phosphate isomerase-like protein (cupin superfamily)